MGLLKARRDTRKKMKYKTCTMKDGETLIGLYSKTDNPGEIKIENVEGDKYLVQESDIVECKDTYNAFQKDVLNGLQLAFKITCNSVYGQVGAATSSVCYKELAASTTAVGRRMVILARDYTLEKISGSTLTYGDSVLGDEPILLKDKTVRLLLKLLKHYHLNGVNIKCLNHLIKIEQKKNNQIVIMKSGHQMVGQKLKKLLDIKLIRKFIE